MNSSRFKTVYFSKYLKGEEKKVSKKWIIKCISLIISLLIILLNITVQAEVDNSINEYIIVSKKANSVIDIIDEENIGSIKMIEKESVGIIVADLKSTEVNQIRRNENVRIVEKNLNLYADAENQSNNLPENDNEKPWNLQMVNAGNISTSTEEKIKIGIIDSGVNHSNEYEVCQDVDYVKNNESSYLYQDLTGHGTSIAGLIASSKNYGINNNAEIYSIKVINKYNVAYLSNVISGIYWAIDNNLDILNMSFGTNIYSKAFENAINDAYNSGILIVASAGNDSDLKYPAAFDNVIAVGSIDNNGNIISTNAHKYDEILFAPGKSILSTGDFNSTVIKSGTSMATPHITAIASVLWQKDKTKSNKFIKELLFSSSNTSISNVKIVDAQCALDNYDVFEANYIEENNSTIVNNEKLDTFSDEIVEALWGKGSHESTVDNYGDDLTLFLKIVSMVPDNEDYTLSNSLNGSNYLNLNSNSVITLSNGTNFTMNDPYHLRYKSILHGRGNYVASVRFLYTVARNLVTKTYSGTRLQKIQSAINASISSSDLAYGTLYGDNTTYATQRIKWVSDETYPYEYIGKVDETMSFTAEEQRILLEKAIYIISNTWFEGQNNAYNEILSKYSNVSSNNSFEVKTALKIIGIATHLCGDLYAHKTVVPINTVFSATTVPSTRNNKTIYRGSKSDFNGNGRWSAKHGVRTLITGNSIITTQQLRAWQYGSDKTGYPDSIYFYNERLSVASKQLVANMYDNFFNGESLGHMGFYVNWFLHTNYSLKLANLKLYSYLIGSQPTRPERLDILNKLDSKVALSDVKPANGYTTPDDSVNTWKSGYGSSY